MGLSASAELVWGVLVTAYDDEGNPSPFWSEEDEDWRTFEGELTVRAFGHYDDPDGPRGILTSGRLKPLRGDCWTPRLVTAGDIPDESRCDKPYSKANDEAREHGLPVDFYRDAGWWLVASYG